VEEGGRKLVDPLDQRAHGRMQSSPVGQTHGGLEAELTEEGMTGVTGLRSAASTIGSHTWPLG
jgi:hypothetical protein